MRLSTKDGTLGWEEFTEMVNTLLPRNLEEKITFTLQAYVPSDLIGEQVENYMFGKKDILNISRSCLEPLF